MLPEVIQPLIFFLSGLCLLYHLWKLLPSNYIPPILHPPTCQRCKTLRKLFTVNWCPRRHSCIQLVGAWRCSFQKCVLFSMIVVRTYTSKQEHQSKGFLNCSSCVLAPWIVCIDLNQCIRSMSAICLLQVNFKLLICCWED